MAQPVDFNNPLNYKKCKKKLYDIHVCMPPKGTVVINKLEQGATVSFVKGRTYFTVAEIEQKKVKNVQEYNIIMGLVQSGRAYIVTEKNPFVLAGTLGELWTISADKLASKYTFLQEGTPVRIDANTLEQRLKDGLLDWTVVRTVPDNSVAWACHVPTNQKGQIQTSWAVLNINGPGCSHGKGDFVIAADANGRPNINSRYVVNGVIFANTYNNQGFADVLAQSKPTDTITIDRLPKLCAGFNPYKENKIIEAVYSILKRLESTAISQMPFRVKKEDFPDGTVLTVKPSIVEDYANKANEAYHKNKTVSLHAQKTKFETFITRISIQNDNILFKGYNISNGGHDKSLAYMFTLPADEQGVAEFQQNLGIYAGLMGYIPNGVQNSFAFTAKPNKYEYDGVEGYTVSSSGMNRKLRLQDTGNHEYERNGAESQRLFRVIDGTDKYFDKVQTRAPLTVFRGMPGSSAVKHGGARSLEELPGHIITNTAYTSATINPQSTLMFAKTKSDNRDGVILAINMPVGMHADFIHNIAAWKEQFEVLWDRKYDIKVEQELLTLKGGNTFTYHIYSASVVEHSPMQFIPSTINTENHQDIPNINMYDRNGRINFGYELIKGVMKEAFDIIKHRGITNIQYQEKLKYDPSLRDFIVVRTGRNDDGTVTDLAFSYNEDSNMLDVFRFKGDEKIRNYWNQEWTRNHVSGKNITWESYAANEEGDAGVGFSMEVKSSIGLRVPANSSLTPENLSKSVAYTILEYVKYNKDVTLLPMQDIGRYLDVVFKTTILNEGYELMDSIAVSRVGDHTNENDGYVPLKYRIDGDNDDRLTIMMKLDRDENNKIRLAYRGQSQNNRVNEQKQLRWNIFDNDVMEKLCKDILYTFAKRLNLKHTRKVDQLLNYIARNRGYVLTEARTGRAKEMNIHEKGNNKCYRLWYTSRSNYLITAQVEGNKCTCYIDGETGSNTVELNMTEPIYVMYRAFIQGIDTLPIGEIA